jgi:hypothetical protein
MESDHPASEIIVEPQAARIQIVLGHRAARIV